MKKYHNYIKENNKIKSQQDELENLFIKKSHFDDLKISFDFLIKPNTLNYYAFIVSAHPITLFTYIKKNKKININYLYIWKELEDYAKSFAGGYNFIINSNFISNTIKNKFGLSDIYYIYYGFGGRENKIVGLKYGK